MKIGVLDTGGEFKNGFFADKKITVMREKGGIQKKEESGLTHAEYVCSLIFEENPGAEVILIPVIHENRKCSVWEMCDGINCLIEAGVDIINLSMGDEYRYHKVIEDVCREAWKKGILIVAAHSNRDVEATFPASFPFVIGVKCEEEKLPKKILYFDEEKNNVVFSNSYFSAYHLETTQLIRGNSFACAKMAGVLSNYREYKDFFAKFVKNKLNLYYPYAALKKKRCCFLSNRMEEELEQRFMKEMTNTVLSRTFEEGSKELEKREESGADYDLIFIDHNSYKNILPYKKLIQSYILRDIRELVLRYPLFSLSERIDFQEKNQKMIQQFFI